VKCEVCSSIEKRDKSFVSKFDGLHKHVGRWKVVAKLDVKVGKYFSSLNNQHAKNEWQFVIMHARGSTID
jgi:hypothetical protein